MVCAIRKRVEEVKAGTPALTASQRPPRPLFDNRNSLAKTSYPFSANLHNYPENVD